MYTGKACLSWLLPCQNGFTDSSSSNSSIVYISSSVDQNLWEDKASTLLQFRSVLPPTCRDKLIPFLCLYFFSLCTKESNVLFKPSMENCVELRDNFCKDIWKYVTTIPPYSDLIPVCELLPRKEMVGTCNSSQCKSHSICNCE